MSMITEYVRLGPGELAELRRLLKESSDDAYEFVAGLAGLAGLADLDVGTGEQAIASRGFDTDKAWAGVEYLMAKLDPPVNVISGGTAMTQDSWAYDPPRRLAPDEVLTAARFLDATPFGQLAERQRPG